MGSLPFLSHSVFIIGSFWWFSLYNLFYYFSWHNSGLCFYNFSSMNFSLIVLFSRLWSSWKPKQLFFFLIQLFARLSTTFSMPSHFSQGYSHSLWHDSRGVTQVASKPSSQSFLKCHLQCSCYTDLPDPQTSQGLPNGQDFVRVAASL